MPQLCKLTTNRFKFVLWFSDDLFTKAVFKGLQSFWGPFCKKAVDIAIKVQTIGLNFIAQKFSHMRLKPITAILSLALLSSCSEKVTDEVPFLDECQMVNGSIKWEFDGSSYCANANIIAGYAIGLTLNGITMTGVSFTMELDSIEPGTYNISQDENNIIYTDQLGLAWTSMDSNAGSIIITSHDSVSNKIRATFNGLLKSPITGQTKQISNGQISVTYVE
jgi:hypothetical protein